jgi:hypothetical protein
MLRQILVHSPAAFFEGFATASLSQTNEQSADHLDILHLFTEFRNLLARTSPPALRGIGGFAKTEEKPPYLIQREAQLPRSQNQREPIHSRFIVPPLSADAWSRREQSNVLVIPHSGRLNPHAAGEFGDCHSLHFDILRAMALAGR